MKSKVPAQKQIITKPGLSKLARSKVNAIAKLIRNGELISRACTKIADPVTYRTLKNWRRKHKWVDKIIQDAIDHKTEVNEEYGGDTLLELLRRKLYEAVTLLDLSDPSSVDRLVKVAALFKKSGGDINIFGDVNQQQNVVYLEYVHADTNQTEAKYNKILEMAASEAEVIE